MEHGPRLTGSFEIRIKVARQSFEKALVHAVGVGAHEVDPVARARIVLTLHDHGEQFSGGDRLVGLQPARDLRDALLHVGFDLERDLDGDVRVQTRRRQCLLGTPDCGDEHVLEVDPRVGETYVDERRHRPETVEKRLVGQRPLEHLLAVLLGERVQQQIEVQDRLVDSLSDSRLGVALRLLVAHLAFTQQVRPVCGTEHAPFAVGVGVHNR